MVTNSNGIINSIRENVLSLGNSNILSVLKRKLDICISFADPYLLGKDLFSFPTKVNYVGA